MSMDRYGEIKGGAPSNKGERIEIQNIGILYALLQDGPVYARYYTPGADSGHLVVVTGVNLYTNTVYTNNPWGVRGKQSFKAFTQGYASKWWQGSGKEPLDCIYLIN